MHFEISLINKFFIILRSHFNQHCPILPMRIITREDFSDIYIKFHQRGLPFLLSKITSDSFQRTKSAFNDNTLETSSFWIVPEVTKRWNKLITGNENTLYEEYLTNKYLKNKDKIKILALGTGVCSHEIRLAEMNPNCEIECFDFSDELLKKGKAISDAKQLDNISYFAENIIQHDFKDKKYHMVFFHASLHHCDHISEFLDQVVIKNLEPKGLLIINEFVGATRLQYSKMQLEYINKAIAVIPKEYRKIFKTDIYKNKYYGSGVLRMIIADPSECVDSESIIPAIHDKFVILEEKFYGNNILQSALKDIAHHFVELNPEKKEVLNKVFELEDELLEKHSSDYVFGVYQLK